MAVAPKARAARLPQAFSGALPSACQAAGPSKPRLASNSSRAPITLVPVFGVLFSSLWLDEATNPSLFLGAALAISGMALMHLGRRRAERRSRQQASAGKT